MSSGGKIFIGPMSAAGAMISLAFIGAWSLNKKGE